MLYNTDQRQHLPHDSKCGYHDESTGTKNRRVTFPYTGCLGHAEVTYELSSRKVLRIRGFLDHNEACRLARMENEPAYAVHPIVYKVALEQLRNGSAWTDIMEKNREYVLACKYPGQTADWAYSHHRWLLKKKDARSLYRQAQRNDGVDVNEKPHRNIDAWLNPSSPEYNSDLAGSVFYYSARAAIDDRVKICIATPEMKKATWRYGHNQQILLDGTFGVCNSKILLFIVMGLDEQRKGVPLAFLLFSAPSGNRFTAAGYDTTILTELLSQWRTSLGTQDECPFYAPVAITDTDIKERNALLEVFPNIWLLLCKFHVRQAWKNHRNQSLKTNSPATGVGEVRVRLSRLEEELIGTTSHEDALRLVATERTTLERLKVVDPTAALAVDGGLAHLDYLSANWVDRIQIWKSWSAHGRNIAAGILGCTFDWVLTTTNHLESFNNVLKNKHLRRWQRNGRRLRLDVLVSILIMKVLPSIFEQRSLEETQRLAWEVRLKRSGAEHLIGRQGNSLRQPGTAYLVPDEFRDTAAAALFERNQIGNPEFDLSGPVVKLTFQCLSAFALETESSATTYTVTMELDGAANCTCGDFVHRGGACKHIRAALKRVDALRAQGTNIPSIPIPTTVDAARVLEATRVAQSVESTVATSDGQFGPVMRAVQVIDDLLHAGDGIFEDGEDAANRSDSEDDVPREKLALSDSDEQTAHISTLTSDMDISELSDEANAHEEAIVNVVAEGEGKKKSVGREEGQPVDRERDQEAVKEPGAESSASYEMRAGDAQAGVNAQALLRTFHELESVAPRLVSFAEQLKYTHLKTEDTEDRQRAESALAQVESLAIQLKRLVLEAQGHHGGLDVVPSTPSVALPVTPPRKKAKRTLLDAELSGPSQSGKGWDPNRKIYAADQEVKQKRKPSFGVF